VTEEARAESDSPTEGGSPVAPFNPLLVLQNATAGRFAIERELGRGGMGIVYLARDLKLDRPVAVKMLPPLAALAEVSRERFVREAKIAASLSHPNIVPIHSFELRDDCAYFVMGYVEGETLEQLVGRTGPLDARTAMSVLRDVAWALDHAHLRGIVHRDVKPGNIILEKEHGRALVMDFGIAHGPFGTPTSPGSGLGTRGFACPEQLRGADADVRADIYGLGATAWFALTGAPPDPSDQAPRSVDYSMILGGIPRRAAFELQRCTSHSPAERPESAGDVARSLSSGLEKVELIPRPIGKWITGGSSLTIPLLLYTLLPFMDFGWPWKLMKFPQYFLVYYGLPWFAFALFRFGLLWNLVHRDYGIIDIRTSLAVWRRERDWKVRASNRRIPAGLAKTVRWGTYAALGIALIGTSTQILRPWPESWWPWWQSNPRDYWLFAFNLTLVAGIVGWIWPRWARPDTDYLADMRLKFWNSPFGAWLVSGAELFNRFRREKDNLQSRLTRNTEVALHMGVSELCQRLGPRLKGELSTVLDVSARLQSQANEVRQAMGSIRDLEVSVRPLSMTVESPDHAEVVNDLLARRSTLEERYLELIGALERLRLGLMRLVARAEMPSEITESLEEAEELSRLLSLLDQAERTVDEELRYHVSD
jgi:hypothetical protein